MYSKRYAEFYALHHNHSVGCCMYTQRSDCATPQQISAGGSSGNFWEFVPDDVRDLPVSSGPDGHANVAVPYGLRHQRFVFYHDGLRLRLSSGEK